MCASLCAKGRGLLNAHQSGRTWKDYWIQFKDSIADRAKVAAEAYHPAPINTMAKKADAARKELDEIRSAVAALASPSAFLISQMTKLEAHVQTLEEEIRAAGRDVNLGWENLRAALGDETTTPAEMSARLKVVFPKGIEITTTSAA